MHMPSFRTALSNFEVDCAKDDPEHFCVVCGLKAVHDEYSLLEFSGGGVVDVANYRSALAHLFAEKEKFQLEKTADAMEALGAILQGLHAKASGDPTLGLDEESTNRPCSPTCPSHQAFALELLEQLRCRCGATSEPLPWDFSSFLLQVYVTDLVSALAPETPSGTPLRVGARSTLTPVIGKLAEAICTINVTSTQNNKVVEECPENCTIKRSVREMQLMSAADGFILNLVWSHEQPKAKEIVTTLALLPGKLAIARLFSMNSHLDRLSLSERTQCSYVLRGFISYGFVHYVSFFLSQENGLWWKYDDSVVRQVGSYTKLLSHMLESRMHPVGVLYERESKERRIREDLDSVSEFEWQALERKATAMDIEAENEDADWECPSCNKANAKGRMVCEVCYSLPKGVSGWACTRCSSRNDEIANLCRTCYEFRHYICSKCHKESTSQDCVFCTVTTSSRVLCMKCRIKRAVSGGLCASCGTEDSQPEESTRKSTKQSDILSQSISFQRCPRCKKILTAGECLNCSKASEDTSIGGLSLSGSGYTRHTLDDTRCLKCAQDKANCACTRETEIRRSVTTFCYQCGKKTGQCACKLPGKIACVLCGKLPSNCICPGTSAGRCKVCSGKSGECECQPSVSDSSKCQKCRLSVCRCSPAAKVSKQLGPDKICIGCQVPLRLDKYCSLCSSSYTASQKKCYACMSHFKGFLCVHCKNKRSIV